MGKIENSKGLVKIIYSPEFLSIYNDQPPSLIADMERFGKPHGYSAQNVFFFFIMRYATQLYSEVEIPEWHKAL